MKRTIGSARAGLVWTGVVLLSLIAPERSTIAAQLNQATVTRIINDVQLLPVQAVPRPAAVNDNVADGTGVKTGMESRTELAFTDQTLARLSANTLFSFNKGTRNLDLAEGAMLLRVPKGARGAKITTAAVTAAISGTTVIIEYHSHGYIKFISLEGIARVYLKRRPGESVLVGPGQMLITNPDAKGLPDPVDVDLDRLLKTSRLIVDFPPLGSKQLITGEIQNQRDQKSRGVLIDTNLVIFGKGTLVSLTNPAQTKAASQPTATSAVPESDAIPSSTDLGTIELPPKPDARGQGP
ncbi:MAG TPA: FecR domain-containing protein [Chthoniobacterales bacterium]|nr:FecR domain-containing protein [Chthoniobacterales bacterium]